MQKHMRGYLPAEHRPSSRDSAAISSLYGLNSSAACVVLITVGLES